MNINDLISMAVKNLKARKLRTFLTVLGVIIGSTSIIVMLSIGFGFQRINTQMYSSMGNLTILDLRKNFDYTEQTSNKMDKKLNDAAVAEVSKVEHVSSVMPIYSARASLSAGRYRNDWVSIVAIPPKVMSDFDFEISEGRLLSSADTKSAVFSGGVSKQFRDDKRPLANVEGKVNPLRTPIEISSIRLESANGMDSYSPIDEPEGPTFSKKLAVTGVLVENPNDWENFNTMYMSIDLLKDLVKQSAQVSKTAAQKFGEYNLIKVKVDDIKNVQAVQKTLKDMGYNASNIYAEIVESQNKTILIIQAVFGAISAVSFLVAAIGITNTMIMSIYERTREIGVMKVIGASISDIKKLFLFEAGFIGLLGGIIGVINSLILSTVFNILARGFISSQIGDMGIDPKISYIPFWLIVVALVFSSLVGVLAGYFPARRAMKLSALDAIRSE